MVGPPEHPIPYPQSTAGSGKGLQHKDDVISRKTQETPQGARLPGASDKNCMYGGSEKYVDMGQ